MRHREFLAECRASVDLYATGSVCTQQLNWCAVDELSLSCLTSWVLLLWNELYYCCIIVLEILYFGIYLIDEIWTCLHLASYHSEAQNDQGRRVKMEF